MLFYEMKPLNIYTAALTAGYHMTENIKRSVALLRLHTVTSNPDGKLNSY